MFVDASAMCAILLSEPEAGDFRRKMAKAAFRFTSAIAVFETVRALMRQKGWEPEHARVMTARFLATADIATLPIGEAEREAALDAMDRFGKGRHAARLNMGDCFAYACAKVHGLPLLFKGDDFAKTDITAA
jgi:ribonuclease VapC